MTDHDVPLFLTVPETAVVLRIGRTKCYQETNRWIATDGRDGIPARKIRGQTRVPTAQLEELFGIRTTAWPVAKMSKVRTERTQPVRQLGAARRDNPKRGRSQRDATQGGLPFAGEAGHAFSAGGLREGARLAGRGR